MVATRPSSLVMGLGQHQKGTHTSRQCCFLQHTSTVATAIAAMPLSARFVLHASAPFFVFGSSLTTITYNHKHATVEQRANQVLAR